METESSSDMMQTRTTRCRIRKSRKRPRSAADKSQEIERYKDIWPSLKYDEEFLNGLEHIVKLGADINAQNGAGGTVLHIFSSRNNFYAVKLLLKLGADIDLMNDSRQTSLHIAAAKGHHILLRLLLMNNADPDIRDISFNTPLMLSIKAGDVRSAKLLLERGAKTGLATPEGFTDLYELYKAFKTNAKLFIIFRRRVRLSLKDITDLILSRDDELIRVLEEAGMDLDLNLDPSYCKSFSLCAMEAMHSAIRRLQASRSDLFLRNRFGKTAFDKAVASGNKWADRYLNKKREMD